MGKSKGKGKGYRASGAVADEVDQMMTRPAPVMVMPGTSTWEEYTIRRILADGRIVDSEPMRSGSAAWSLGLQQLAYPAGTTVQVRWRQITAHATDWDEVDPADLSVLGPKGPFADTIAALDRMVLGTPEDEPEQAPALPSDLLPGVVRRASAGVSVDGSLWVADDLDTDQVRLLGEHGWAVEARGGQLLVRRPGTVPAGEQPTVDLTAKAARAAARYNDVQRFGEGPVTDPAADWRTSAANHTEHGRSQFPDTCRLCQDEADADRATTAERPPVDWYFTEPNHSEHQRGRYPATCTACAGEAAQLDADPALDLPDDRATEEIPKVDAGPHAVPAGEGAQRRAAERKGRAFHSSHDLGQYPEHCTDCGQESERHDRSMQ